MRDVVFGLSLSYGEGVQTSVAINNKGRIIEVHEWKGDFKKLRYHTAESRQMDVLWGDSREYDDGLSPSVALNDSDLVVEIHKAQFWDELWYHVAQINGDKVDWGPSQKIGSGVFPSVALTNDNWCVEVHNSQGNAGLWYHVGHVDQKAKTIAWGDSYKYDNGYEPKVAMNNMGVIVEVHKSEESDTLMYRVGIIEKKDKTINWGPGHQYDNGLQPSVAITDDGFVIEVHKSQSVGTLYRHVGVINVDNKVIKWSASEDYDTGSAPSVAVVSDGSMAIQTHQSVWLAESPSNLWFSTSLVIDRMRWMESQYDTLRTKPLWQVTLPGSHDSGAYDMGTERVPARCRDADDRIPGEITRPFATAQNQDIASQLQNGCRFFDLRPYYKDGKIYAYHDVIGANFENMLDDVANFLNKTSRELVILKVSHFCSFDDEQHREHKQLVGLVKQKLGDKMFTNMSVNLLTTTIGEFVGQGSKVIVWYEHDYIEKPSIPGFWREISIYDSYSDTDECCKMECDQLKKMIKRSGSSNKLFLLSWTLTFKDLNSLTKGASLQTIAAKANRELGRFLAENADDCQVNVLYVDFLRDARVTDCAVILNR